MTADQLRAAEQRYKKHLAGVDQYRKWRDDDIRQALAEGWSQRQVADATGLTHGRIGQIALSRR